MKSIVRVGSLLLINLFVAMLVVIVLYPAKGLYLERYSDATYIVLSANALVLMAVAMWGVFRPAPLLTRCSSTLAIAALVTANLAFSAPMTGGVMSREDGFALLACFVVLPWLLMTVVKSIPRFGMQIGRKYKDEIRVFRQPLRTGDLIASTFFVAVIIYVYLTIFPAQMPHGKAWLSGGNLNWGEGIATALILTGVAMFALWSGLNSRTWVFVICFGVLSLFGVTSFYNTMTTNLPKGIEEVGPFLLMMGIGVATVILIPLSLRLVGYRVTNRKNAVFISGDANQQTTVSSTPNRWSRFSSLSLPIAGIAVLWILIANISGTTQRHPFHCLADFVYGEATSEETRGQISHVAIATNDAEQLLRSSLFPPIASVTLIANKQETGEINEGLRDAIAESQSLFKLRVPDSPIQADQFIRIASARPFKQLETRYPTGLLQSLNANTSPHSSREPPIYGIEELLFNVVSEKESSELTADALGCILRDFGLKSIRLTYDRGAGIQPTWKAEEIARLCKQHPKTSFDVPFQRGGRMSRIGEKLDIETALLFENDVLDTIRVLQPSTFVSWQSRTEFALKDMMMISDTQQPARFTSEQQQTLAEFKQATKCIKIIVSDLPDELFLDHFATGEAIEFACYDGSFPAEAATLIASHKNIETLTLHCESLQQGVVKALQDAHGLKTLYLGGLPKETIDFVTQELGNITVESLSDRALIPWHSNF